MKMIQKTAGIVSLAAVMLAGAAMGLELKELQLPMTRDEADSSLSKDYDYTILSDSTIRRTWKLKGRKVHVDFKLNRQGQALCIAVEYSKPASQKTVHNDIKAVTGGKSSYKKLGKPKKNTNTYGMEHALGAKVKSSDGKSEGWIFVEHTGADRKKCTRFVYYSSKPSRDRMSLSAAQEDGGYTAMGSAGANIDLSALRADEEARRRTTKGSTTTKPDKAPVVVDVPDEPVAVDSSSDDGFGTPDSVGELEDEATDSEKAAGSGKGFLPKAIAEPVHKALGGLGLSAMVMDILTVLVPLLLLIIVWRKIAGKKRAKLQQAAFNSIMNRGTNNTEENK